MAAGARPGEARRRRERLRGREAELRLLGRLARARPRRGVEVWYAAELRAQAAADRARLERLEQRWAAGGGPAARGGAAG